MLNNKQKDKVKKMLSERPIKYGTALDEIGFSFINKHEFTAPLTASSAAIHAAVALTSGSQAVTTGITNPDISRVLSVKGTAAGVTGNIVYTGRNIMGDVITETIASSGTSEVSGSQAFSSVSQIVLPSGAGSSIAMGMTDRFGLLDKLIGDTVMKVLCDGASEASYTLTTDTSVLSKNTLKPVTASDGSKDFIAYYIGY